MNRIINIGAATIETDQGINQNDERFGYIHAGPGGYFFDWKPTLDGTLDSINQDTESTQEEPDISFTEVREALREAIADSFDTE